MCEVSCLLCRVYGHRQGEEEIKTIFVCWGRVVVDIVKIFLDAKKNR